MTPIEFCKQRATTGLKQDIVELWMDDEFVAWRDNQIVVDSNYSLKARDARCFAGLSVFLHTEKYTPAVAKNFQLLQNNANYIMVAITDFGDELGFEWRKQ